MAVLRKILGRFLTMKANWLVFLFLFNPYFSNGEETGKNITDAFYEDVRKLFTCLYRNCTTYNNTLYVNGCDCGPECMIFDTCCPDSLYRKMQTPQIQPSCRSIKNSKSLYLMIDECPADDDSDVVLKDLCVEEGHKEDDLMSLVPVTSLLSNVTYKNYFCFRCHETHGDFVFWHLLIKSSSKPDTEVRDESISLSYNDVQKTWKASFEKDGPVFDVEISIEPNYAHAKCFINVTSTCSENWQDDEIRSKCNGYTFITEIKKNDTINAYRNPHCALCNFENLNQTDCERYTRYSSGGGNLFSFDRNCSGGYIVNRRSFCRISVRDPFLKICKCFMKFRPVIPFSFTHLFDINGSGGSKVGRKELCDENSVWDPFSKKCRIIGCVVTEYVIKNGACVPP